MAIIGEKNIPHVHGVSQPLAMKTWLPPRPRALATVPSNGGSEFLRMKSFPVALPEQTTFSTPLDAYALRPTCTPPSGSRPRWLVDRQQD